MINKKKGSSKSSGNTSRGKAGSGKSKPAFAFEKPSRGSRGAGRPTGGKGYAAGEKEEPRGPRKTTSRGPGRPAGAKSSFAGARDEERGERKSAPRGAAGRPSGGKGFSSSERDEERGPKKPGARSGSAGRPAGKGFSAGDRDEAKGSKRASSKGGASSKKSSRPASAIRTKSEDNFEKRSGITPRKPAAFNRAPKSFSKAPRDGYEKQEESKFNEDEFFGRTESSSYSGKKTADSKSKTGKPAGKSSPGKKEGMTKRAEMALVRRKVDKDFIDIKFSRERETTDSLHRELNVKKARAKDQPSEDDGIRLNRYLSNAGIASRREADEFIQEGLVRINGVVVTELGVKVMPGDSVKFRSKVVSPEKNIYVLLNKPKDFITTTDDPQERRTVMALVANACKERIVPVGRLDRNTTGLLLFTNDGDLAQKLTHPSSNIKKIYLVELDKPIAEKDFETIKSGKLRLFDGPVRVDDLAVTDHTRKVLGIEIHEGRNRIVRRIFEELGYKVEKLDRVAYAGLTKKDLSRGKWRFLSVQEINRLKYLG